MNPRFYFATCQFGAEKAVKAEVLGRHPELRFAFSRPGFITFKQEEASKPLIEKRPGVFERLWGQSIGQAKERAALLELLKLLPERAILQVFERDTFVPGDDPPGFVPRARARALEQEIREASPELASRFRWNERPQAGETVYDLVWLDDFHVFLGQHRHHASIDPAPGNLPEIALPSDAPSRAYLKLAEAVHRFRIPVEAGCSALEVGCSPGGATHFMLSQGMSVIGIDPKEPSPAILAHPEFELIAKPAKAVTAGDLGDFNPSWLVMDMNLAPPNALDELTHVLKLLRKAHGKKLGLRYGMITLKLNDWKFAERVPQYLKRLEELGFRELVALQLASNRQEFFVQARGFQ